MGPQAVPPIATHSDVTNTTNTTTEATISYSPASPDSDAEQDKDDEEADNHEQNHTSHTSLSLSASGSPPSERHSTAEAAYEDMLADFGEAQAPRAEMEDAEFDLSPMAQITQLEMMVARHSAQLDEEQDWIDEERQRIVSGQHEPAFRQPEPEPTQEVESLKARETPSPEPERFRAPGPEIESDLEAEIEPETDSEPEPEPEPAKSHVRVSEPSPEPEVAQSSPEPEPDFKPEPTQTSVYKFSIREPVKEPEPRPRVFKPVCRKTRHRPRSQPDPLLRSLFSPSLCCRRETKLAPLLCSFAHCLYRCRNSAGDGA